MSDGQNHEFRELLETGAIDRKPIYRMVVCAILKLLHYYIYQLQLWMQKFVSYLIELKCWYLFLLPKNEKNDEINC